MPFPTSPANNQTALVNGIVYQWNSALGVWKRNGSINSASIGQLLLTSAQQSTTNGSGTLIVSGGAGITGNVYTGGIFITGSANGITFADGSSQTTAASLSITDDTTNSGTYYPVLTTSTSGTLSRANTSSSKLSYVPSTGTLTVVDLNTTSDLKLKENIEPISSALDIINKIDGVSFNWKETGRKSYGVIAQQLQEILPELVSQEDRGLSVSYLPLIALLIEAIKEQQKQIENLK